MAETHSPPTSVPSFHLLCIHERFSSAFKEAVQTLYPNLHEQVTITIHDCDLRSLDKDLRFDAVVSPANSYARLDGAFDDALAKAYGPKDDYGWITRKAQSTLYKKWRGFAPPGTCTIVPLLDDDDNGATANASSNADTTTSTNPPNPWGTKFLLLCPTMAVPWDVQWDREVVYECIWSLLCAVDTHNQSSTSDSGRINSILMTPLATGVGRVRPQRWAEQCVLAIKHWIEAGAKPELWSRLEWDDISLRQDELEATFMDDVPSREL